MENNIITFLKDYSILYNKVKIIIIVSENFSDKMYIAPVNELRNSLDHIAKAISDEKNAEYEINKAKEHLLRAGYDCWELLSIDFVKDITDRLNKYDAETIAAVFPQYYTDVKPELVNIREQLINVRLSSEKYQFDIDTLLLKIEELQKIKSAVEKQVPLLENYFKNRKRNWFKKEQAWNNLWGILIGFISATLISILIWLLTK